MSATYTLHAARGAAPGDPAALERADLVRDGFSWGAFLAPALWLLWHRHWLLAPVALAVVVGTAFGLAALGLRPGAIIWVEILLHAFFGLEASSLRRWALARAGRPTVDVVAANDRAEAEAKSFARWLAPVPTLDRVGVAPSGASAWLRRAPEPVIGLFPDLEGRR